MKEVRDRFRLIIKALEYKYVFIMEINIEKEGN